MTLFRELPANSCGRDFVVGDVHGCFATLAQLLRAANFDEGADRLLCVGDLVDRGPASAQVMDWLAQPWLHAVRGNHEQMAIVYHDGAADEVLCERYRRNGGDWFMSLDQAARQPYRDAFAALPLALQLTVAGQRVGIVHADCPDDDWDGLLRLLAQGEDTPCGNGHSVLRQATWCRERAQGVPRRAVAGIDLLCVGHTPQALARQRDNVLYLDTGAVYGEHLSLLCLADMSLTVQPCVEGVIAPD